MYKILEDFGKQVENHTTGLGAVWYILVFGFRLFIVSTIGGSVYNDEQGQFSCSEKLVGCTQQCYNQFAKISHIRFWAFQIIGVSLPTMLFHYYCVHQKSQIEKVKAAEEALKKLQAETDSNQRNEKQMKEISNLDKRRKRLGPYKFKSVYRGDKISEIPQSRKIMIANLLNLMVRLIIEIIFIVFGAYLFNIQGGYRGQSLSFLNFLFMDVPGYYNCQPLDDAVKVACAQHFTKGPNGEKTTMGTIPCYVSRQYEKTFLLRFMNIVSVVCVLITIYELVAIVMRAVRHSKYKKLNDKENNMGFFAALDNDNVLSRPPYSPTARSNVNYRYSEIELNAIHQPDVKRPSSKLGRGVKPKLTRNPSNDDYMYESDVMSIPSSDKGAREKKARD